MGEYKNIGNAQVHAVRAFFFIGGFGSASWAPLVPLLRERLAIGDDVLGMLLLCVGIGSLVTMPLAGALSTRLGCRKVLTVTAVVYAAVLVAICAVDSLLLAVPVILLFGTLMGCVDVVINVAAVIVEQGIGRRIMSGTHAFWSIGGFVGAGLYGVWVGAMGLTPMQSTLIAAGVILLFTGLFGSRLIPYGGGGGRLIAIPRGIIVFIGIAAFIAFLSEGAVMDWSGVYLTTVRGFDLALAGVGFSVFSGAMFLMRLLGDAVVQRLGQRRVAVGGRSARVRRYFARDVRACGCASLCGVLCDRYRGGEYCSGLFLSHGETERYADRRGGFCREYDGLPRYPRRSRSNRPCLASGEFAGCIWDFGGAVFTSSLCRYACFPTHLLV